MSTGTSTRSYRTDKPVHLSLGTVHTHILVYYVWILRYSCTSTVNSKAQVPIVVPGFLLGMSTAVVPVITFRNLVFAKWKISDVGIY